MKFWFRQWVKRHLGMVDRSDHDSLWLKWSTAVATDFYTLTRLSNSLDILTKNNEVLVRENTDLIQRFHKVMLELSIINVAPLETMDRAYDILRFGAPQAEPVVRAIAELKHGIDLMRKMPAIKTALSK